MKIKINFFIFIVILISIIGFPLYYQSRILAQNEITKNICLIVKNQNDDYWKNVQLGAETAAKEYNVKLSVMKTKGECSVLEQETLINEAIEKNTDAILLTPCSFNGLVEPVENAADKKIPVLMLDGKIDSEKVSSTIATDNLSAGKSAGEKLVSLAGVNSVVAIVGSDKEIGSNSSERYEGLRKYISENYQGVQLIDGSEGINDSSGAELVTEKLLLSNNKISAIAALNYETSIGVARAIEKLGLRGKVIVVGFDGDPEEIKYMESGIIQAVVMQSPFSMGYLGVKNAVLKLQGKAIPKSIESGFTVIDKDNMYLPENQKILFPFTQ